MSDDVARCIELLTRAPSTTVLCSDFDGTLAQLVDDPTTSQPIPEAITALSALSTTFAAVAVISGRPVAFLAERLGHSAAGRLDLFGRYGAEHRRSDGRIVESEVSANLRRHLIEIGDEAAARVPGILVEDKGSSLSLHWRARPETEEEILEIASQHVARGDIEIREGKMVVEFVATGAPTKGVSLSSLLTENVTTCCFLGDDLSDLDAFDALDDFESRGGTGLRIGIGSSEMPSALRARADLILNGPIAAAAFLSELADRLS